MKFRTLFGIFIVIFVIETTDKIRFGWRMKQWPWRVPKSNRIYTPGSNE